MKTLGVIAGMGPFASTNFIHRILELTPAPKEWDHIRIKVDYNITIPSRTRCLLYDEPSPLAGIIDTVNGLARAGSDLVAVPCNSAHYWYKAAQSELEIPWLNIIEITAQRVQELGIQRPLIAGAYVTVTQRIYDEFLEGTCYLSEPEMNRLFRMIERLKLGECRQAVKRDFLDLIAPYQDKVDGLVLACTEPSMLFDSDERSVGSLRIIDSMHEYAKRCVELFKGVKS